jgi:hypothetical protein
MAKNSKQEMIWRGRIHLGDEPGVFGDAFYSGLTAELPATIYRSKDRKGTSFVITLETEDLETYKGYPGHEVVVKIYEPDPNLQFHSLERIIARSTFNSEHKNRKDLTIDVGQAHGPFRISVHMRCDTRVNPGYYDDFIWKRLLLSSDDHNFYAAFGFRD